MALENKKSLLQPSSAQSQQYRLQFSNLVPTSVAPLATTTAQQPAPVANRRPAVSAFVSAPAPVSLQAPATIPPSLPAPAAAAPAAAPTTPLVYKSSALFFGEGLHYSASVDDGISVGDIKFLNFYDSTFMAYIKPTNARPWNKESIFHIYSGSAVSHSLEVYLTGSDIAVEYSHNNQSYVRSVTMPNVGNFGNGYYLIRLVSGKNNRALLYPNLGGWPYAGGDSANFPSGFDTSNATDMKLGLSFSGSMDYITFIYNGKLTSADEAGLKNGTIKPDQISNYTRIYRGYSDVPYMAELTGSNAAASVTLSSYNMVGSSTFYLT